MPVNRSLMAYVSLQVDRFWQRFWQNHERGNRARLDCRICHADTPISQPVETLRESVREHRDVGVHQPLRGGGDGGT